MKRHLLYQKQPSGDNPAGNTHGAHYKTFSRSVATALDQPIFYTLDSAPTTCPSRPPSREKATETAAAYLQRVVGTPLSELNIQVSSPSFLPASG